MQTPLRLKSSNQLLKDQLSNNITRQLQIIDGQHSHANYQNSPSAAGDSPEQGIDPPNLFQNYTPALQIYKQKNQYFMMVIHIMLYILSVFVIGFGLCQVIMNNCCKVNYLTRARDIERELGTTMQYNRYLGSYNKTFSFKHVKFKRDTEEQSDVDKDASGESLESDSDLDDSGDFDVLEDERYNLFGVLGENPMKSNQDKIKDAIYQKHGELQIIKMALYVTREKQLNQIQLQPANQSNMDSFAETPPKFHQKRMNSRNQSGKFKRATDKKFNQLISQNSKSMNQQKTLQKIFKYEDREFKDIVADESLSLVEFLFEIYSKLNKSNEFFRQTEFVEFLIDLISIKWIYDQLQTMPEVCIKLCTPPSTLEETQQKQHQNSQSPFVMRQYTKRKWVEQTSEIEVLAKQLYLEARREILKDFKYPQLLFLFTQVTGDDKAVMLSNTQLQFYLKKLEWQFNNATNFNKIFQDNFNQFLKNTKNLHPDLRRAKINLFHKTSTAARITSKQEASQAKQLEEMGFKRNADGQFDQQQIQELEQYLQIQLEKERNKKKFKFQTEQAQNQKR